MFYIVHATLKQLSLL